MIVGGGKSFVPNSSEIGSHTQKRGRISTGIPLHAGDVAHVELRNQDGSFKKNYPPVTVAAPTSQADAVQYLSLSQ